MADWYCTVGVASRMLPHEFPAWGTVSSSFRRWEREGVWEQILQTPRTQMRTKPDQDEEPSAASIGSQSITTSAVRGAQKGDDAGKRSWGRKRHVLIETQRHLLAIVVTGAQISDQEGGWSLPSVAS